MSDTAYGTIVQRDWNSLSDEEFRAIVRADIENNYPAEIRYPPTRLRWSVNGAWWRRWASTGWIAPNWPVEFGGMGLDPQKHLIFVEEQERWGVGRFLDPGIHMVGPVLMRWGTPAQQRRFLPGILSCEELWCQGYSEPNAGSDLASLRTVGRVDGDRLVVNGQKIWTTLAQDATHIFALVRTEPEAEKHRGISFVLIDMKSAGIQVRPIRDLAGHEEFCEVFFEDVSVPLDNVVGQLGQGWTVAKSLLGHERLFIGSPKLPEYGLRVLMNVARERGLLDDPWFRARRTELELDLLDLSSLYERYAGQVRRGEVLGDEVSLLKIWATDTFQRIAELAVEIAGPGAALPPQPGQDPSVYALAAYYKSRPPSIFAGTNEIQRNIIAKRVLHLS